MKQRSTVLCVYQFCKLSFSIRTSSFALLPLPFSRYPLTFIRMDKIKFGTDGWRGVIAATAAPGQTTRASAKAATSILRALGSGQTRLDSRRDSRLSSSEYSASGVLAS